MKSVTELKSLGDIRTATSHHIASKPPLKGSTHLDIYLLDKERQRLEKELSGLEVRGRRILERLGEIRKAMDMLKQKAEEAEQERLADGHPTATEVKQPAPASQSSHRQWKKMTLSY